MRWISLISSGYSIQMQKTTPSSQCTLCRRLHLLNAHGTFSRIDHILGHKSNLSKFKKIEIVSGIFSDHNPMRQHINLKEKKNCLLSSQLGDVISNSKFFILCWFIIWNVRSWLLVSFNHTTFFPFIHMPCHLMVFDHWPLVVRTSNSCSDFGACSGLLVPALDFSACMISCYFVTLL